MNVNRANVGVADPIYQSREPSRVDVDKSGVSNETEIGKYSFISVFFSYYLVFNTRYPAFV